MRKNAAGKLAARRCRRAPDMSEARCCAAPVDAPPCKMSLICSATKYECYCNGIGNLFTPSEQLVPCGADPPEIVILREAPFGFAQGRLKDPRLERPRQHRPKLRILRLRSCLAPLRMTLRSG